MTPARTRKISSKLRRSPAEIADDVYDAMPTTLYDPAGRSSGVLRAAPRYFRGGPPSPARANAPTLAAIPSRTNTPSHPRTPSPLATFSLPGSRRAPPRSPVSEEHARISEMLRELPVVPTMDASRPLICAPNPFLTPPDPMAPPPLWMVRSKRASGRVQQRPKARRSMLPFLTAALAVAIAIGLSHDDRARSEVTSDLTRAAERAGAFVMEAAIR